jgi:hypothetical protein
MTALDTSPSLPTVIFPSSPLWPKTKRKNGCRYIMAMKRRPLDVGDDGIGVFPLSAYCYTPLQPPLAYIDQPKLLSLY